MFKSDSVKLDVYGDAVISGNIIIGNDYSTHILSGTTYISKDIKINGFINSNKEQDSTINWFIKFR